MKLKVRQRERKIVGHRERKREIDRERESKR